MSEINGQVICDDCGGFDIEWMHRCYKHKADYCRGCECVICEEEEVDDYDAILTELIEACDG